MAMYRAQFAKLLTEGLRKVFFLGYNESSHVYPRIYDIQKSKKQTETDHSIASIGMLDAKAEGASITYEDFVPGYTVNYTHTSYAKGIRITRELMDDELYGVMGKRVKALGRSARYRKEYDHAAMFNNATSTTAAGAFVGGDSLALASDSHTLANAPGTTVDNYLGTTALSSYALEKAFMYFREMVDDSNMLIGMTPRALLVPAELEFDAWEIINSDRGVPYTDNATAPTHNANTTENFFASHKLDIIVWPFLTDANRYFVLADKSDGAPISFNRVATEFDNDGDFDTKDLKVSAYTRYSYGFSDWRWCYCGEAS